MPRAEAPAGHPGVAQPRKRKAQPRQKHVPLRTCIACRESRPKRELIRVVRTPDGHITLDPTSKKSGRGAYVCARRSCWDIALKKGKLEREFEMTLLPEDRAALEDYYATLPPEPVAPPTRQGSTTRKSGEKSRPTPQD